MFFDCETNHVVDENNFGDVSVVNYFMTSGLGHSGYITYSVTHILIPVPMRTCYNCFRSLQTKISENQNDHREKKTVEAILKFYETQNRLTKL